MTVDTINQPSIRAKAGGVQGKNASAPLVGLLRAIKARSQNFFTNQLVLGYSPCDASDPASVCFYSVREVTKRRFFFLPFTRENMVFSATPACHDEFHDGESTLDLSCHVFDHRLTELAKEELLRYAGDHGAKVHLGHLVFVPESTHRPVRLARVSKVMPPGVGKLAASA